MFVEVDPDDVPPGRRVVLPGRGRTYVREVAGPPGAPVVVLLHGLGATGGLNWAGAFSLLGSRFRVIAVDHRGHGRGIRTKKFRLEDCADDVAGLLDELGIESCIPVGYSMGGSIATLMWRRHPRLTSGLVLMATSRNFSGRPADRMAFAAMGLAAAVRLPAPPGARLLFSASQRVPLLGPLIRPPHWALDELCRHDPRSLLQAASALGRFSCHRWAPTIDVPVAVVATTHDRIVPVSRQVSLAAAIPSAVLHPVDSGHLAVGPLGGPTLLEATLDSCTEVARRARLADGGASPLPDACAECDLGLLPA
jgi:3-oxoadipate enol-lactonase